MRSLRTSIEALIVLAGCGMLAQAPAGAQQFKGQIKVGIHQTKLEAGKIYTVELASDCADSDFPILNCSPTHLTVLFADKPRNDRMFVIPTKTEVHTFFLISPLGPLEKAVVNYTLTVKPLTGEFEKPILHKKITIGDNDPIYKPRNSRHKVETIKLKAGTTYVIDLVKSNNDQDPYLYVEDASMRILAEDDDSGGDVNARIFFRPEQDGDYRIIATSLDNVTGDMTLSVRALPAKK
jgi:hypothetical protein